MVTELERALVAAAGPLQSTRLAAVLRNAARSKPDGSMPHPSDRALGWELSFHPALQRAIAGEIGRALESRTTPEENEWIRWNRAALRAMARISSRCWSGVDAQIRAAFIDRDNLHPLWNGGYLNDLRHDETGPALVFEGLDDPEVQLALRAVWNAAKETPTFYAAVEAASQLRVRPSLLSLFGRLSAAGLQSLNEAQKVSTIGIGRTRGLEIVDSVYAGTQIEPLVIQLRRHNRLVQDVCHTLLGFADNPPVIVRSTYGAVRCSTSTETGSPTVRLSVDDDVTGHLRLSHPVELAMGLPLDGLHLVEAYTLSFEASAAVDLSVVPLRWSEGRWPSR